jgi:hypothetical protein
MDLSRRNFGKLSAAALGGMLAAGSMTGSAFALDKKPESPKEGMHVCRGLNACKGQGADGKNDCAGQGACSTVEKHGCKGDNACKNQGGCGEHPGENACKGMGNCHVPLDAKGWKKARANFEAKMKKDGKPFGEPHKA